MFLYFLAHFLYYRYLLIWTQKNLRFSKNSTFLKSSFLINVFKTDKYLILVPDRKGTRFFIKKLIFICILDFAVIIFVLKKREIKFWIFLSGPTVLFERFQSNGRSRQYYACSACRDRKDCSFFHWADEKFSKTKRDLWDKFIKDSEPKDTEEELSRRWLILFPIFQYILFWKYPSELVFCYLH